MSSHACYVYFSGLNSWFLSQCKHTEFSNLSCNLNVSLKIPKCWRPMFFCCLTTGYKTPVAWRAEIKSWVPEWIHVSYAKICRLVSLRVVEREIQDRNRSSICSFSLPLWGHQWIDKFLAYFTGFPFFLHLKLVFLLLLRPG